MARLTDQRNAHALCMLAENERYRREATEAGFRQRGDNRRRTHDEIARNVHLVKHNTVVDYLENVLTDCVDKMAEKSARDQIRDIVRKIDEDAEDPSPQRVVTGILNRFVLPDVFTHIARESHLADVHKSLFGKVPDMISEDKRSRMNRFLEAAVTPRDDDQDNVSVLSSLDSQEDPAHHEAMRCVELAIGKALYGNKKFDQTGAFGLLDEIIRSVIPDNQESDQQSELSRHGQLNEIVADVSEQLWTAVENAGSDYCMPTVDQPEESNKNDSNSWIQPVAAVDTTRTSVWKLDEDDVVDILERRSSKVDENEDSSSEHASDGGSEKSTGEVVSI